MLTKGLDNIQGTSGNDTIIGSIDASAELNTLSVLDIINGGAGTDTLKIATSKDDAIVLGNVSNVEIVEVEGAARVSIDTTSTAGVTDLKVLKAGAFKDVAAGADFDNVADAAVVAKAAATTNINVSLKQAVAVDGGATKADDVNAAITVDGGKDVTIAVTDVNAVTSTSATGIGAPSANKDLTQINVGTTTAAKGDVSVTTTGKAASGTADAKLSTITVNGGKTVTVTQKATSDASAAATDKTAGNHKVVQGAVAVNGNADTTTVTVKQDAYVAGVQAVDAVANKDKTYAITFKALAKGEKIGLTDGANTLTFTASKALDAAEVASAFANLGKNALQGNASTKLGEYTTSTTKGLEKWFSGAVEVVDADNAKVTFSATGNEATALTATAGSTPGKVSVGTVVGGTDKDDAVTGVLGVDAGLVTITDKSAAHDALKTITVDGYATGSRIGDGTNDTTALNNLTLKNAQGAASMTVDKAAATLDLTVEKLGSSSVAAKTGVETLTKAQLTFTAAPTTLNVTSTGNNYITLTDSANAIETLNASGTGLLDVSTNDLAGLKTVKVSGTAGLTLNAGVANTVTSVDTTGTTGTTTITIEGDRATYAGGAGVDNVTVANANTAIDKAINLGAGNDTLTLAVTPGGSVAVPTVELNGGDGDDTIAMSAADAVALSAGTAFEAKMSGFEILSLNTKATATGTVNLANMDDISYVISAGSNATAGAAATETADVTFKDLLIGQSVTVAGLTLTNTTAAVILAADVATAFEGLAAAVTAGDAGGAPALTDAAWSGSLTGWKTTGETAAAGVLTFTSITADSNVTDISKNQAGVGAATVVAEGTFTDGDGTAAEAKIDWTMEALLKGQSVTINGVTVIAQKNLADTEVAAAFAAAMTSAGNYTVDAFGYTPPSGFTGTTAASFTAVGAALTLTNSSGSNAVVTPAYTDDAAARTPTVNAIVAAPTPVDVETTDGISAAEAATPMLTLDNLASNGTVELNATSDGVVVKVKDATTGTADVLNIVTNAADGASAGTLVDLGKVVANKVETINVEAKDAISGTNVSLNELQIDGDKAATVNVKGAGNLTLTFSSASKALTTVDGSTASGKLDITSVKNDGENLVIKGGLGDDTLTSAGQNDKLFGNEGNDVLKAAGTIALVELSGGAGIDSFDVSAANSKTAASVVRITDFEKGETIKFAANANASFLSTKFELTGGAGLSDYVGQAIAKAYEYAGNNAFGIAWFQQGGNTYIVQDKGATAGAFDNQDVVVELTGLVDLSASSFNDNTAGTLLFI